jgi:spore germination protein D
MLHRLAPIGAVALLAAVLVSCGQSSGGGQTMSYKEVKSMVIDILGSDEAKKIIEKSASASGEGTLLMNSSMTPRDHEQIKLVVKDVLTSPDYSRVLETIMKDPKFAGEFAKAVSKDNKQIHKDLMKDPEYQKDLIDMLKNPEAQRILSDSMKTTEYRKQMQASVSEAIQSPLFKLEIMKLLQTVVKEELTPKASQQQGQGGKEGEQQGGGGGGDGGQGGGGDGGGSGGG